MRTFYKIFANTLFATVANFFVWFAATFWLYLETKNVLGTAIIGGGFMVVSSLGGFWFGSLVDHHRKKNVMLLSSAATVAFFAIALGVYATSPLESFKSLTSVRLWGVIVPAMLGVTAGNIRSIALATLTTVLVPEDRRANANGLSGIVMGISSSGAGVASGAVLAHSTMFWVLLVGIVCAGLAIVHLALVAIPEPPKSETEQTHHRIDVRGTVALMRTIPGLFALVFFTCFNNFLGGVFMALADAYGLSMVSVQVWGTLWGFISMGFIVGGLYVAKAGLGKEPLQRFFSANTVIWVTCIVFTLQPSIVLYAAGLVVWVLVMPSIEATEHTIMQKVVPYERQGRVFGFAQSLEMGASPLSAFLIGPITQFILMPFMTTGRGAEWIGPWFGTGPERGIALAFTAAGIVGLTVTLVAKRSRAYRRLADRYHAAPETAAASEVVA